MQLFGNQATTAGQVLSVAPLGRFMHAPVTSGNFTYTIDWGDGSTPDSGTATIVDPGSASTQLVGTIAGQHTYAAVGDYNVVATVTDPDGLSDTQTFEVAVSTPAGLPQSDGETGLPPAPPVATSITCSTSDPIDASQATFDVSFSEPVQNVSAADFTLDCLGTTAAIAGVAPQTDSGTDPYYSTYTVTVDNIQVIDPSGRGSVGLELIDNGTFADSITDGNGIPLSGGGRETAPWSARRTRSTPICIMTQVSAAIGTGRT